MLSFALKTCEADLQAFTYLTDIFWDGGPRLCVIRQNVLFDGRDNISLVKRILYLLQSYAKV